MNDDARRERGHFSRRRFDDDGAGNDEAKTTAMRVELQASVRYGLALARGATYRVDR